MQLLKRLLIRRFVILTTLLMAISSEGFAATEADVIVYGSTPGGFCAAIAAAREGASVILLEPTDHIGAMSTGGLSHCDSNQMVRDTLMGLFDEWHTRIVRDYTDRGLKAPYNPALKDQPPFSPMYSAKPRFPRPFRQKQTPSSQSLHLRSDCKDD